MTDLREISKCLAVAAEKLEKADKFRLSLIDRLKKQVVYSAGVLNKTAKKRDLKENARHLGIIVECTDILECMGISVEDSSSWQEDFHSYSKVVFGGKETFCLSSDKGAEA
jgi:hypothetical protein